MKAPTTGQSARSFLDSIIASGQGFNDEYGIALRGQAALIRTLLDEMQRRPPGDLWLGDLFAQLEDEVARLARLLVEATASRAHETAS